MQSSLMDSMQPRRRGEAGTVNLRCLEMLVGANIKDNEGIAAHAARRVDKCVSKPPGNGRGPL